MTVVWPELSAKRLAPTISARARIERVCVDTASANELLTESLPFND